MSIIEKFIPKKKPDLSDVDSVLEVLDLLRRNPDSAELEFPFFEFDPTVPPKISFPEVEGDEWKQARQELSDLLSFGGAFEKRFAASCRRWGDADGRVLLEISFAPIYECGGISHHGDRRSVFVHLPADKGETK